MDRFRQALTCHGDLTPSIINKVLVVGVDSEGVQDGDASTTETAVGTTTEADSEPDDGFLPGQAENGLLRPGQIHE